jgi:ABC-type transporter Mla subunit MlaD
MRSLIKWLFHQKPDAHDREVEHNNRNLAQTQQVVESSANRLGRAVRQEEVLRRSLESSRQHLEQSLDQLAARLKRMHKDSEEGNH